MTRSPGLSFSRAIWPLSASIFLRFSSPAPQTRLRLSWEERQQRTYDKARLLAIVPYTAVDQVATQEAHDSIIHATRFNQLQQAWDLLDKLRGTEADDEFTASTVAMVAVQAEHEAKSQQLRAVRQRSLAWLTLAAVVLLSMASGYVVLHRRLTRADRKLVRDLPVIEHVDEYSNVDNVSFLKLLARENLFPSEVDDGT